MTHTAKQIVKAKVVRPSAVLAPGAGWVLESVISVPPQIGDETPDRDVALLLFGCLDICEVVGCRLSECPAELRSIFSELISASRRLENALGKT